jgi:sulfur carrier protein
MKITVNGEAQDFPEGTTLRDLLSRLQINRGRVACEVNMNIVKRAEDEKTLLRDGDVLEIVQMIGGG